MKKIVISFLLASFLLAPIFVLAQTATQQETTQRLIQTLTQEIAQLEQQIQQIMTQQQSEAKALSQISQNTTPSSTPSTTAVTPGATSVCTPNWQCSGFGACTNGVQTQTCTDSNNCNVTTGEPVLIQSCATTSIPATNLSIGTGTSLNWSGYAVTGTNLTSVSGSWVMPQVASSTSLTSDATWIGIGGITSTDLIQIGTETFSDNGQIQHQAFYETLPQDSVSIPMTVNAGDPITASLTEQSTAGQWLLSIKDNTNEQSFQTTVSYTSSNSSAEWVEEMPSNTSGNAFIPIDGFGTVQFSGGSVVQNGSTETIAQSVSQMMTMINNSDQALATVSALGSDGASFSVTRTSAAPTSSTNFQRSSSTTHYRRGFGVQGYTHFQNNSVSGTTSNGSSGMTSPGQNFRRFNMFFRF